MARFQDTAVETFKIAKCRRLVDSGVDINCRDSMGMTPLHHAVENSAGRTSLIRGLVDLGADINARDIIGRTPMFFLLSNNAFEKTGIYIFEPHSDVVLKQIQSIVERLERLPKACRDIVDLEKMQERPTDMIQNLLYTDVDKLIGPIQISTLECLLKLGADINATFHDTTSLHRAVRLKNKHGIEFLARFGDLVNAERARNINLLLWAVKMHRRTIIKSLSKYGVDILNKSTCEFLTPLHEAVIQGETKTVRLLAELGADMNRQRLQGVSPLLFAISLPRILPGAFDIRTIKALIDAGADYNIGWRHLTPVHDAVRLGDKEMVQTLAELKANMNTGSQEDYTPLHVATTSGLKDIISYLARKGADMNVQFSRGVTPLHYAVRMGNVDMVDCLIKEGADPVHKQGTGLTALHIAITTGQNGTLKQLVECGADINVSSSKEISVLHYAAEHSDVNMVATLIQLLNEDMITSRGHTGRTLLHASILEDNIAATEILLQHRIRQTPLLQTSPLDVALKHGDPEKISLLGSARLRDRKFALSSQVQPASSPGCIDQNRVIIYGRDVNAHGRFGKDTAGSTLTNCIFTDSPLHIASYVGRINHSRILIIYGADVDECHRDGKKPLKRLPLADTVNYRVLNEAAAAKNARENVQISDISVTGCPSLAAVLSTPGMGDVRYIPNLSPAEISERVFKLLQPIPQHCKTFSTGTLIGVGGAGERTKVGLPDEMDFLFTMKTPTDIEIEITDKGYDYVQYECRSRLRAISMPTFLIKESKTFHEHFTTDINHALVDLYLSHDEKVWIISLATNPSLNQDRKACSTLCLQWIDGNAAFRIPVDLVPCLHINDWPKGAVTRTWLMEYKELLSRGYVIVPMPPHVESDVAKTYNGDELHSMWKISFPHLETEHMQRLNQRVKDVYLTAKALRNPDVCRILIRDDGLLRNTDKYISSYLLKMCVFKNVEYFLRSELSLDEMVCKVFDDLEKGLRESFIPLFFLPKVCAFEGRKIDVPKFAKVAKIMARFVRALYLRDCTNDPAEVLDGEDDEVVIDVYQRESSSVYKAYNIN